MLFDVTITTHQHDTGDIVPETYVVDCESEAELRIRLYDQLDPIIEQNIDRFKIDVEIAPHRPKSLLGLGQLAAQLSSRFD